MRSTILAGHLSLTDKYDYLRSFSEDEFRDRFLRPLFLRMGLQDGREYCGPTEEGKDCLFVDRDPLGDMNIYAVQTKKGNINMSAKATKNVLNVATQVLMMLETEIPMVSPLGKRRPTKVFLCASGKINDAARRYIIEKVSNPQVQFLDLDDLVPRADEHFPEFWLGVDTDKSPYLSTLLESLGTQQELSTSGVDIFTVPIHDDALIELRVNRLTVKKGKVRGQFHSQEVTRPEFKEFPIDQLTTGSDKYVLLIAEAGEGKTTALRRLAAQVAKAGLADLGNATVPLLLRATKLAKTDGPLVDTFIEHTKAISPSREAAFSEDDLEAGRILLLVDGLDEIPDAGDRDKLMVRLLRFSKEYPRCRVVLSSRNYLWLEDLPGIHSFERYKISPINWREASKLVRKLARGKDLPEERTAELLRRLQEVHGMDLNPLLVTVFLASTDAQRYDIPANITELFKKFTEQMLGRWDEHKGLGLQFQAPLKDFLLKLVALEMHRNQLTSITLGDLETVLERELVERGQSANTKNLIDEMVHRSGLFRILGDEVEFRHLLLQEFFAGRAMTARDVKAVIGDSWWQRCVVFYFGEHPDDLDTLQDAVSHIRAQPRSNRMQASITVGLALQACYLMGLDDKAVLYIDILDSMGQASVALHGAESSTSGPVLPFISEYLAARDAATCDVLRTASERVASLLESTSRSDWSEYVKYWYIVGLVECGLLEEALEELRNFDPKDRRSLLSLHLGAFLYEKARVASKGERDSAKRIREYLAPKVDHLRSALLDEFRSELLEIRRGKVAELEEDATFGSLD